MPLLGLFSKKSKSPIKASAAIPSTSNVSLNENEWVSVTTTVASGTGRRPQRQQQQSSSSTVPTRMSSDETVYDPPTRHSSLFPFQSDTDMRSTQSLPGHNDPDTRQYKAHNLSSSPPLPSQPPKKSFLNWVSSKDRSHTTTASVKSTSDSGDTSFNLKAFRHIRPESPSFTSMNAPSSTTVVLRPPSPKTPALVPVPTSSLPPPPVSFQVTSRKPRLPLQTSLSSDLSTSPTSAIFPSPQSQSSQVTPRSRVAAGVFQQAARRSATSLTLSDPNLNASATSGGAATGLGAGLTLSFEDEFNRATSTLSSSPPKLPLFSFSNSTSNTNSNPTTDVSNISNTSVPRPPRPQPPPKLTAHHPSSSPISYTQLNHSSASASVPPSSSLSANSSSSPTTTTASPESTSAKSAPSSSNSRLAQSGRRNYFGSSSETSESEAEDSESESDDSDDSASGPPRVSRKRTVRPRTNATNLGTLSSSNTAAANSAPGRPRAATTTSAPLRPNQIGSVASCSQIDLPPPPVINAQQPRSVKDSPSLDRSFVPTLTPADTTFPRSPSALNVHATGGARPRASASVGALHHSANEARASAILVADQRLSTATNLSTAKSMHTSLSRNPGSDTSESASDRDSDEEDAPLSKLVPPRRPGTSMSSYSTGSNSSLNKKPLVDLSAPSTFSGRPIGAPAPISREEEEMPKPRILVDTTGRSSPSLKDLSTTGKVVPSPQLQPPSQQQPGKRPSKAPLSLSSGSPMSSPSSSGASLATSSRGLGGASSDTSVSPTDHNSRYHSFANGGANLIGGMGARSNTGATTNSNSMSAVPPSRPFVRRDSPTTSSTGDSSSGKVPLTPKDGNDLRQSNRPPSALALNKNHSRPTHGRKPSVTFEDELSPADKELRLTAGNVQSKVKESYPDIDEARRRERRRTEARAAIELGRVVNGPPPVDDDDIGLDAGAQVAWPQFGMQMPMTMPMQPMFNMSGGMAGMGMNPQMQMPFSTPMPNGDPALLAAHQQAMAVAKHAFQCAVAQQALAAANEEWERNSTMTGFMPPGGGYMNMRGSMMFPPAPMSMYAGNAGGGSLINGFGGLGGGGSIGGPGPWAGTRSVYGDSFGPATPTAMRLSTYSSTDLTAFNPALAGAGGGPGGFVQGGLSPGQQRPGMRQRTKTAPSSQTSPVQATPPVPSSKSPVRTRALAPPSSFRGVPSQ